MADIGIIGGKYTAYKDPDDVRYYQYGFAADLTLSGTAPHATRPPVIITSGATVGDGTVIGSGLALATHPDSLPNVQVVGTDVIVYLGGLNVQAGQEQKNFCTVRLNCANGEQIDRTIWFTREDH